MIWSGASDGPLFGIIDECDRPVTLCSGSRSRDAVCNQSSMRFSTHAKFLASQNIQTYTTSPRGVIWVHHAWNGA